MSLVSFTMAEPEDLEEDLFADLYDVPVPLFFLDSESNHETGRYDADDTTNHATPAVEAPKVPLSTESTVHTQTTDAPGPRSDVSKTEAENVKESYQVPLIGGVYQNGGDLATGVHDATATAGDHEPHGTGIKEDG